MSMFKAIELGHQLDKTEFQQREEALKTGLLEAQRRLRDSRSTLLIIVAGVEGSGKGRVVSRLNTWLDNRGVRTNAYWDESDEERERPYLWRFWRDLPARGSTGIMFGSWYTQPIVDMALGRCRQIDFEQRLTEINELERVLSEDNVIILKLWYHLSEKTQAKLLKEEGEAGLKGSPWLREHAPLRDEFSRVSELAIRHTDQSYSPWHLIEAEDARYRDIATGEILLETLQQRLDQEAEWAEHAKQDPFARGTHMPDANRSILDLVDLGQSLDDADYKRQLSALQQEASDLAWRAREAGINVVCVFEGWDAAGKGGAIRRLTQAIDARLYQVISVAAPTDEEKARHYLWRFWRQVPRSGRITIYDRSWYGRVLVERVEGFASHREWFRAYHEINAFEKQLTDFGTVVMKFWLHISPEEQLERFKAREKIPWKKHKITEEDWRNRDRWDDYRLAVNEMVERTSSRKAPWHIIPANDKQFARVQVLAHFCQALRTQLEATDHSSGHSVRK